MDSKTKDILQKFSSQKIELGKVENILKEAEKITPYDTLLKLHRVAQATEKELYGVLQDIEKLQAEAKNMKKLAEQLGADSAIKTLQSAENVLSTKFRRTRESIKIAQAGGKLLS